MSHYSVKPKIVAEALSKESIESFGIGSEVLILVSKTVKKKFGLETLFEELGSTRNFYVFDHIRPDAPFEDLDGVLKKMGNRRPTDILAIGGGSIIDAAKTLSVSFSGIDYKDIFYKRAELPEEKIKVLAVPTTAGTGAELSFGAIIYDSENRIKGGIRGEKIQPNGVLIDARLHNACPAKLKAEVGFDCLTHAVETYISKKSNPIVKDHSVNCIQNIFKHLIPACKGNSLSDMEKIAISSTMMGINLAYSSTCLPHRIQYVIGPMTHTSHAKGLIALYKGWLTHLAENEIAELDNLAKELGMDTASLCDSITTLKAQLEIPYSLADLGIKKHQIQTIAQKVSGNMQADPSYQDTNSIINILKHAL